MRNNIQNVSWKDYKAFRDVRSVQTGTWVVKDSDTTLDPVGIQMGKQSRKIQKINSKDYNLCMIENHWDDEVMRAYVESVTTIPRQPNEPERVILSDIYNGSLIRVDFSGNIRWFDNAWNSSWKTNTLPCYWTKSYDKRDQFSVAFDEYNARRPNESKRVILSDMKSSNDLRSSFKEFLADHASSEEIHVWIQGKATLDGSKWGIPRIRNFLENIFENERMDMPRDVNVNEHLKYISRSMISPLISEFDPNIKNLIDCDKKVVIMAIKIKDIANLIKLGGTIIHHRLVMMNESGFGLEEAEHVMIYNLSQGCMLHHICDIKRPGLYGLVSREPQLYYSKAVGRLSMLELLLPRVSKDVNRYWTADVEKVSVHANEIPHPLNVIPWRVSNMGLIAVRDTLPQMFPNTKLFKDHPQLRYRFMRVINEINRGDTSCNVYVNYNPHVRMRHARPTDDVDFVWAEYGGTYHMVMPFVGENAFVIDDWSLFMGLGSVICAWHSIFGVLRDNESLYNQMTNKEERLKPEPSGHMIAASLSPLSHLMWYLQEIDINNETKKSIYLLSFNEPRDGEFHSKYEYLSSIIELEKYFKSVSNTLYKNMRRTLHTIRCNISLLNEYVLYVLFKDVVRKELLKDDN